MRKPLHLSVSVGVLIPLMLLWGSCATLLSGSDQRVDIRSSPPGAKVYLNGQYTYKKTPCRLYVDRKGNANSKVQHYMLKKEGYAEYEKSDHAVFNPMTLGNILFGNILGLGVDWLSGSIYKYEQEVYAILEDNPEKAGPPVRVAATQPGAQSREGSSSAQPEQPAESPLSDVDVNIPVSPGKHPYRFALIIGNEDYSSHQPDLGSEVDVEYARHDARVFKQYAIRTMGIPQRNVVYLEDATAGKMTHAFHKMNLLAKNSEGEAELYFYYAGHGLPDEKNREPYLLPVDVSGKNIQSGIRLKEVYRQLTEYPVSRVTVFLDACFTGGARQQGLLAARSVKIKPLQRQLPGNIVVFSASSGVQSALPYREKHHGFFTYHLLRKLQDTSGDITYREMADYLRRKVSLESILVNDKEQNPRVNVSPDIKEDWQYWKFIPRD